MKKTIALLLCLALCLGMAACGAFHDHTWSYDDKNHWCDCECGKQIEPLPHNLYDNVCVACGVEILDFGDFKFVQCYNDHDCIKAVTEYDTNGNIIQDARYEWEYDADGNPVRSVMHLDGVLAEEVTYQPCLGEDTAVCMKERIEYYEDGSRRVLTYDENGDIQSNTVYLADGSIKE